MMRTVSCRQHADSSNPPLIRLHNTSLNPAENRALLDLYSNETSKTLLSEQLTFYAEHFVLQQHEAKQEMYEMCFLSVKIEGTCPKHMCVMHAYSPCTQMHVEQKPF